MNLVYLICPGALGYVVRCEKDAALRGETCVGVPESDARIVVCVDLGVTASVIRRVKELGARKIWMRSLGLGLFFSDFLGGPADDVAMDTEEMMPVEEA